MREALTHELAEVQPKRALGLEARRAARKEEGALAGPFGYLSSSGYARGLDVANLRESKAATLFRHVFSDLPWR